MYLLKSSNHDRVYAMRVSKPRRLNVGERTNRLDRAIEPLSFSVITMSKDLNNLRADRVLTRSQLFLADTHHQLDSCPCAGIAGRSTSVTQSARDSEMMPAVCYGNRKCLEILSGRVGKLTKTYPNRKLYMGGPLPPIILAVVRWH